MPYKGTHSLKELVEKGLLNANIKKAFTDDEFAVYKRYNHQEKAIKLVGEQKSIIVASGTGSGKTECFFIPIINELLNEYDKNSLKKVEMKQMSFIKQLMEKMLYQTNC